MRSRMRQFLRIVCRIIRIEFPLTAGLKLQKYLPFLLGSSRSKRESQKIKALYFLIQDSVGIPAVDDFGLLRVHFSRQRRNRSWISLSTNSACCLVRQCTTMSSAYRSNGVSGCCCCIHASKARWDRSAAQIRQDRGRRLLPAVPSHAPAVFRLPSSYRAFSHRSTYSKITAGSCTAQSAFAWQLVVNIEKEGA